jgi:hypothetical protein
MAIATAVAMCTNGRRPQLLSVILGYYWLCKKLYDAVVYIVEFLLMLPAELSSFWTFTVQIGGYNEAG